VSSRKSALMPINEFFLSTEVALDIEAVDAAGADSAERWMQVAQSGIARPALVVRAGESVVMANGLALLAGSRLLLRYGPAIDAMSADGATLLVELVCDHRIHPLAELPVRSDGAVQTATFSLDACTGGPWRIR